MSKIAISKTLETIASTKGCKFANLTYENKEGEIAKHTILLGASLENAYRSDLEALKAYEVELEIEKQALAEMIKSKENSLSKGIGNNDAYTQSGVWESIAPNLRYDSEAGKIQVFGMQISKTVLKAGVYKQVNSRPKTLAKKAIEKKLGLKASKIRAFSLDANNLSKVSANGEAIDFE